MNGSPESAAQTMPSSNDPGIDKNLLYGRYQSHEDKKNTLGLKMAYKALDIPDEEMNIDASKVETHNHYHNAEGGTEPKSLAGRLLPLVATALIAGATPVGAMWWAGVFDDKSPPAATTTDTNTRYTLEAMKGE